MSVPSAAELKALAKSILTAVGSLGGLLYLLERLQHLVEGFRNRQRLAIRILNQVNASGLSQVRFEAENRGATPTSLHPTIEMTGLWLLGGEFHRWEYRFALETEADRSLEPHKPKLFHATSAGDEGSLGAFTFLLVSGLHVPHNARSTSADVLRTIAGPPLS